MPGGMSLIFDVLAIDRASHVFKDVGNSATRAAGQVESASNAMQSTAAKMAVGVGLAGAAFAAISVKMAGDFQQSVTKLATTAGESQKNLKMVGDGMLAMAGQVGIGANELAKGMYIVESSGIHGAKALDVLKASAQGARQEGADLTKVTDAVTTALHDYNMPASEAAKVTSEMVTAVSAGKTTFDQLTGSLHSVTPLAAALHVPFADIIGSLAAMTASGESADQATQNMADALRHLQAPTHPMADELAQLGITASDLARDLGTKGLSGTMQEISKAIIDHMDPATRQVLLPLMNQSKIAAHDAKLMFDSLPPALQKVATAYQSGTMTVGDWRKAVKDMPADQQMLATSWKSMEDKALGFSAALKSGNPVAQQYSAALQKATGDSAGLTVALQLTGEHAKTVNKSIVDISNSSGDAKGNIKGWAEVQGNFNQQLAQAGAAIGTMFIQFGQHLLPALTTGLGWLNSTGLPAIKSFGSGVGDVVKWFAALPGPIRDAALALAAFKIADMAGLITNVFGRGGLVDGAALRLMTFGDSAKAGLGKVSEAFSVAKAASAFIQEGELGAQASRLNGTLAGLGAAAGVAAKGGMAALKSAGSGLMNMFGGPWGLAMAGAAAGIGLIQWAMQKHDETVKKATDDVTAWNKAIALGAGGASAVAAAQHIDDLRAKIAALQSQVGGKSNENLLNAFSWFNPAAGAIMGHLKDQRDELNKGTQAWKDQLAAMSPVEEAQARVDVATKDYTDALKHNSTTSPVVTNAVMRLSQAQSFLAAETDRATQAQKSQIQQQLDASNALIGEAQAKDAAIHAQSQLNTALASYRALAKPSADDSATLADSARNFAQSQADAAVAQAKANGVTDTGTVGQVAYLKALQQASTQMGLSTPASISALISSMTAAMGATGATVGSFQHLGAQSDEEKQKLQDLGHVIATLPDGSVIVTADTHPAEAAIRDLLQYARTQSINYRSTLPDLVPNVSGGGRMGHAATGGEIHGPGTGTSDTAGLWALSDGEFVVNARATAQHRELLHAINNGMLGHAATGGYIGDLTASIPVTIDEASAKAAIYAQAQAIYNPVGSGVERWRAAVDQVLMLLGQPTSLDNGVLSLMQMESGGNPNAINLTDINAQLGHPSQGLMQTIPATFAAYAGPYIARGITDGFANIYAGVNYGLHVYGPGLFAAGGRHDASGHYIGYETGTDFVPETGPYILHKGEAVITAKENAARGDGTTVIKIYDVDNKLIGTMDGRILEYDGASANASRYNG